MRRARGGGGVAEGDRTGPGAAARVRVGGGNLAGAGPSCSRLRCSPSRVTCVRVRDGE